MPDQPFNSNSATVSLAVGQSTGRVAVTVRHGSSVRIVNDGDEVVFIKFGDATVEAATTDMPMLPNTVEVFGVDAGTTHVAAISDASPASATLYLTPGDGV